MNQSYVLGSKPIPDWFKEAFSKGLVKQVKNEDTGEVTFTVYETTTIVKAEKGDKIVKTRSGLTVVKKQNKGKEEND